MTATIQTPPPIFQQIRECHVNELFVRESARRQGIATKLVERIEAWATDRGCDRLDLNVHRENRAAIRLYEANGYSVKRYNMKKPLPDDR